MRATSCHLLAPPLGLLAAVAQVADRGWVVWRRCPTCVCGKSAGYTAHPSVDIYSFGVMVRLILTQVNGGKAQLLPVAWWPVPHVHAHISALWFCGSDFRCRSHSIRAAAAEVYSTEPNGTSDSLGGAVLVAGARAAQRHSR
eukprot:COSAG02_NODE_2270_length_9267_cov_13.803992_4_plen_142_part_00